MPVHRLRPLSALGRQFLASDSIGPVTIAESMDVALASLAARRGREAEIEALAARAGIPLPGPAQAAWQGEWGAFWAGPSLWFLEAPLATREDIVAHLKPLFGEAASITEQTDAWVRLEVAGPLAALFERLGHPHGDRASGGPCDPPRARSHDPARAEVVGGLAAPRAPRGGAERVLA